MTVTQVREMIEKDSSVVLLDVRTPIEWRNESGHLKDAILIPVQELEARVKELAPYKHKTIIAYCRSGNRSGTATKFLDAQGFNVFNMEGGMIQWNTEKFPVVKEKPE
ncbi:MAG: rhodanese-like domain-containing protein [Ignavibacteriales bacterium]|nr:rhodanese-like domain-containing protein [Ignavibacteriales bacterium]